MASINQKNTGPEKKVRTFLFSKGFRYRLHVQTLPGKPDIVLPKYNTVIFVNGCFWHGHLDPSCKLARIPKSNTEFWKAKIHKNMLRDAENIESLKSSGWRVIVVWECELKRKDYLKTIVDKLLAGE